MNESGRSAETDYELEAKAKDKKDPKDYQGQQGYPTDYQGNDQGDPDPFCCTPIGGGSGPDTGI